MKALCITLGLLATLTSLAPGQFALPNSVPSHRAGRIIKNPLANEPVTSANFLSNDLPQVPPETARSYTMTEKMREACTHGNLDQVKQLLGDHELLNAPINHFGVTPLMAAGKFPDVVRYLLSQGAQTDLMDNDGNTVLLNACFYNQPEVIQALLEAGANPNLPNGEGRLPLMDVAKNGNDRMVTLLLAHHADINGNDDAGPAIWRAVEQRKISTVKLLIDRGADLKLKPFPVDPDRRSWSLLSEAANDRDPAMAVLELLLTRGVSVNDAGVDGTTALMRACRYNQTVAISRLLDRGAALEQQNENGTTALMLASKYGADLAVKLLLDYHAQLETKDHQGRTALVMACMEAHESTARALLDHGANVNVTDAQGETPLTYAGDRGEVSLVAELKAHGATRTDLHIIAKEMPPAPLSPAQRWELSVAALYCQRNGESPNLLGHGSDPETSWQTKSQLVKDWNVHDDLGLLEILERLQDDHNRSRSEYLKEGAQLALLPEPVFWLVLQSNSERKGELEAQCESYRRWKDRSGLAWDLCRAAYLVDNGVAAHYFDEREGWTLLAPIARKAQAHFSSWREMSDNFLDARPMWLGEKDPRFKACADLLCNPKDPNSPWNQAPWPTDLSQP